MAFDIYVWPVTTAKLVVGSTLSFAYPTGRKAGSYKPTGSHYALAPNEALVKAPAGFTVVFNVGQIDVTWATSEVPIGKIVQFQFQRYAGPLVEGVEVALADMTNVDLTATGFQPAVSPAFTGIPTAPTAAPGTNTTQISTTAFVAAAIAALVNSSPAALDTLKELADALGDDPNFAASVATSLGLKAPSASPTITGLLAAAERFALTGHISPAQITADQNDYNPAGLGTASVLRLSTDAARNLNGLVSDAVNGRLVAVHNVGVNPLTLTHDNAGSTAANRFYLPSNASWTLPAGGTVLLMYGTLAQRWRPIGSPPVDPTQFASPGFAVAMALAY